MSSKSKQALILPLLAIGGMLSLPPPGAGQTQTFRGCDVDDAICMDGLVGESCLQRLPDERASCVDILADLERRLSLAEPEVLMSAAFAHSMLAQYPESDAAAASHRAAAEELLRRLLAIDPNRSSAYLGMSQLAATPDEQIRWLRLAAEASDYASLMSRFLAQALDLQGTYESRLEAAEVMRAAYERYEPGRHKWYLAQSVLARYRGLELHAEASQFLDEVGVDYGLAARLDALSGAASSPEAAIETLASLCSQEIFRLFGASACRTAAGRLLATAERADDPTLALQLALGTLRETMELPSVPDERSWAPDMVPWFERLLRAGIDAWQIQAALGRCRLALDRPDAALEAFEQARLLATEAGATFAEVEYIDDALYAIRNDRLPAFYRESCPTRVIVIE